MYKKSSMKGTSAKGKGVTMPADQDVTKESGPGTLGSGNTMRASKMNQGPRGKKRKVPSV